MPDWVRVAAVNELPQRTGKEVVAGNRVLALFLVGETVYAIDGICLHAGGPLAEGKLEGPIITCPWHGWQYDVTTGRHCLNANLCTTSFPVEICDGDVFVQV